MSWKGIKSADMRYLKGKDRIGRLVCRILLCLAVFPPAVWPISSDDHLFYFAATGSTIHNVVTVQWETRTEPWTSGYFVWRGEKRDGSYARIHHHIIAAQGGDTWGGFYTFDDYGVVSGKTYYYKIQEIEESGIERFYGPIASDGSMDCNDCRDKDNVSISCFIGSLF